MSKRVTYAAQTNRLDGLYPVTDGAVPQERTAGDERPRHLPMATSVDAPIPRPRTDHRSIEIPKVHVPSGYDITSAEVRAICWCGWRGPPRASRAAATGALGLAHPLTRAVCACCGCAGGRRGLVDSSPYAGLDIVFGPISGSERLVCRDRAICRSWPPGQSPPHDLWVGTEN